MDDCLIIPSITQPKMTQSKIRAEQVRRGRIVLKWTKSTPQETWSEYYRKLDERRRS